MPMVRDIGFTLPDLLDTLLVTCGAVISTGASTGPDIIKLNATGDILVSTGNPLSGTAGLTTGFGRVIDRLAAPLGAGYYQALPVAYLNATRGSTEADRQILIGVKLQHGDSSAGGDMADYSTGQQPADRFYFGTGRTCDMLSWEFSGRSTGPLNAASNPAMYDLSGAKRYLRVAVRVGKDRVTTESSGDEHARVGAAITFLAADNLPQVADTLRFSPYTTSTSTSLT